MAPKMAELTPSTTSPGLMSCRIRAVSPTDIAEKIPTTMGGTMNSAMIAATEYARRGVYAATTAPTPQYTPDSSSDTAR